MKDVHFCAFTCIHTDQYTLVLMIVIPSIYTLSIETTRAFYRAVRCFSKKRKGFLSNLILMQTPSRTECSSLSPRETLIE